MSKQVMSFEEFFNKTEENKLIKFKDDIKKVIEISAINTLCFEKIIFADTIDTIGSSFWIYVRQFSRWGCICMAGLEIYRSIHNQDLKEVVKIIAKYSIAYASIISLPNIFMKIDQTFKVIK